MAPNIKSAQEIEEARAIMPSVTRIFNTLDSFKVNSPSTWLTAGSKILEIKDKVKEIKRIRKTILDPINEAKDNTMAFFDPAIEKCEEIVSVLGNRMSEWKTEQDKIEEEKRKKAEAEAKEKERIEQQRLKEEAAEKERKEKELLEKAKKAQEKGNLQASQQFVEQAAEVKEEVKEIKQEAREVVVEAKVVTSKAPKISGLSFRTNWKFEILDERKLPREFLKADEAAIRAHVSENKDKAKIPGVRIYSEETPVG